MRKGMKCALIIVLVAGTGLLFLGYYLWNSSETLPVITSNFVELNKVANISKFRSCQGHEYPSGADPRACEKHYIGFKPEYDQNEALEVKVFAIWDGVVDQINEESSGRGQQLVLKSMNYYAIYFHVSVKPGLVVGSELRGGDELGYADVPVPNRAYSTGFDLAIHHGTAFGAGTALSFFEIIPDSIFEEYMSRGVREKGDFIISQDYRSSHSCACRKYEGGTCIFDGEATMEMDWITLL